MSSFQYIGQSSLVYTAGKADPYSTSIAKWIKTTSEIGSHYDLCVVGIPLSKSSISFSGSHSHPQIFRKVWSSFTTYHWDEDIDLQDMSVVDLGDVKMHVTSIEQCHQNIQAAALEVKNNLPHTFPVFVGGDHSTTAAVVKGLKQAKDQRIGIIQFDAHLDVRDMSYGGASNGTPMRNLIESRTVKGEDIVNIGLRPFANSKEYRKYAEETGYPLFSMNQVRTQGFQQIVAWAKEYLGTKCDQVYVTFDIDSFDQSITSGVPAIGPAGFQTEEIFDAAFQLGQWEKTMAMDMVCVDPTTDVRDMSTRVSVHVFLHFISGFYKKMKIYNSSSIAKTIIIY